MGEFLFAAIFIAPINYKSIYHRFALALIPPVTLALNFILKTFFHINFFEGTGGQPINFDYKQFFHFMFTGL